MKKQALDEQKAVTPEPTNSPDQGDLGAVAVSESEQRPTDPDGPDKLSDTGPTGESKRDKQPRDSRRSDDPDLKLVSSSDSVSIVGNPSDNVDLSSAGGTELEGGGVSDSDASDEQLHLDPREQRDGELEDSGDDNRGQQQEGQSDSADLRRGILVSNSEPNSPVELIDILKVSAKNVVRYYPLFLKDLQEVIRKAETGISPSQVFDVLEQDRGWLILVFNKLTKKYRGFVIVSQEDPDQFTDSKPFLVWFAYCKTPGIAKKVFLELEDMARNLGYTDIIMRSKRKGWERLSEMYGFTLRERVFSKQL